MLIRRPVVLVIQSAQEPGLGAGLDEDCLTIQESQPEIAYEIARAKQPDVIAVDVTIAGGTGWALSRLLKRDPLTTSIPLVILSATGTPETAAHAQYIGASAVFTEPATVADLLDALRDTRTESSAA